MRSAKEIEEERNKFASEVERGNRIAEGIWDALNWVLGESDTSASEYHLGED